MKIAIITGGSRGIGKSTALDLAKRGVGVILTYNSHGEEAEAVVWEIEKNGGKAVALKLDVTRVKSFEDFTEQVSHTLEEDFSQKTFDYLVNNAGIAQRTLIKDVTEEQFDELVDVHFKGVFFLTQKLIPLMSDGGHVIFVSSGFNPSHERSRRCRLRCGKRRHRSHDPIFRFGICQAKNPRQLRGARRPGH